MAQQDACSLLDADHVRVEQLFAEYDKSADDARKAELARQICQELKVHMEIEDEIFYPAFQEATGDARLVKQSEHEHDETRELIRQLEGARRIDDATMKKLEDVVRDHVKDERTKMFPEARNSASMDLMKLADELQARKSQLLTEHIA
jgi:hemerythrin superfamily protein